ncbi:MAG: HAD family hydrolase [Gammaproteobacteria bacterium]
MAHPERNYSAVLLDFDGTYADTAPDMIGALNALRARADRPPVDYKAARPYVSHGSRALVNLGFGDYSQSEQTRLVGDFLDAYESNVASQTRAFEGIENWIDLLEKESIKWGIVTNKPEYLTDAVLAQMPLPHTPHCVVAGDSLVKRKPHPMPALHAAALIKAPARECLFVGDALSDITAGRTAGMYTIAAAYGYILPSDDPYSWNAHKVATSVAELCEHANSVLGIA